MPRSGQTYGAGVLSFWLGSDCEAVLVVPLQIQMALLIKFFVDVQSVQCMRNLCRGLWNGLDKLNCETRGSSPHSSPILTCFCF